MKSSFWFACYNGMGGHPVLSFAPDLLLPTESDSFGNAVGEFEICAHVELSRDPKLESDFLMRRFRDRLPTLPKAWFRRKARRIEIAYLSHVGCAEELLEGDFIAKTVPDAATLRRTCFEVAASFALLKKCVKSSDEFDVGGFLRYINSKIAEVSALDEGQLLQRLAEAQAAEQARIARAT